jgi:hypothetical protein
MPLHLTPAPASPAPDTELLARQAGHLMSLAAQLLPGVLLALSAAKSQRVTFLLDSGFSAALEMTVNLAGLAELNLVCVSPEGVRELIGKLRAIDSGAALPPMQ